MANERINIASNASPDELSADPLSRTYSKIAWRIMPLLFIGYLLNFLDRTNISIAALQMNQSLGFTPTIYATGAALFFLAYAVFEIPSNLVMYRVGARIWFMRIMVTWGILSAACAFIGTPTSFYILRFLLGVAEAGFAPGFLFFLTLWFPSAYLARANALIIMGSPLSSIFGSPLSGALLSMNGVAGLEGWQWLFIIEGVPAVIVGVLIFFFLCDSPKDASWLTNDEKTLLSRRLAAEDNAKKNKHDYSLLQTFLHPRLILICLINFCWCFGFYGFLFWLPQIIKAFGGLTNFQISLLNALPALFGAGAMVAWAWHSDRTNERNWHVAIPMFLAGIALVVSTLFSSPVYSMIALIGAGIGFYAFYSSFYTLAPAFLSGTAAAGGLALMTTAGNVGGFVGPYVVGWLREGFGDFHYALLGCAALVAIGGLIAVLIKRIGNADSVTEA
jgi:D-galactonate transporter